MSPDRPICLVVDLAPLREFLDAVDALAVQWAALTPEERRPLARLLWLHPSGEVVQYRPPEEDSCPSTE